MKEQSDQMKDTSIREETTWTIKSPYNSPPRVGIVKSVQGCTEITREIIRMVEFHSFVDLMSH